LASVPSVHQLEASQNSLNVPTTAPGEVARIGPVSFKIPNRSTYYSAWRMVDSKNQKTFTGDPEVVTQLSVTAVPAICQVTTEP